MEQYRPNKSRSRSVCLAHSSHHPEREALRSRPLYVQGCEIWNGNYPIESAITLVRQIEQPQGGNGKRKRLTATKVAESFPSQG
jgi:hypothetical protein